MNSTLDFKKILNKINISEKKLVVLGLPVIVIENVG